MADTKQETTTETTDEKKRIRIKTGRRKAKKRVWKTKLVKVGRGSKTMGKKKSA